MAHLPAVVLPAVRAGLPLFRRHAIALACVAAASAAHAQSSDSTPLPAVVVKAPSSATASPSLTGFGAVPLADVPMQTTVISRDQIEESQARRLADLMFFDASASDAYNSPGYWDYVSLRGFTLDQNYNYLREGLPISGETVIPLANKERVEFLKGTSGIQAGTSAPGGLVNYVVKRPTDVTLRTATFALGDRGSLGGAVDLGGRAGEGGVFGYRLNVAYDNSRPQIDAYDHAEQYVAAFAGDWRLAPESLLEVEGEWSHQVSASLPGYSLTGDAVPSTRRPANLNNQPWSQPNKFDGVFTGTLRFTQGLGDGWRWISTLGTQHLKTDDRLAYAYGYQCGVSTGANLCDRYGANGNYDLYDFRSEDEHRRVQVARTALQGEVRAGRVSHALNGGLQYTRRTKHVQDQAYNYVGEGNIDGSLVTPADPTLTSTGTNAEERNLELFATDAIDWGNGLTSWLGLRATRLDRETVDTHGDNATAYDDHFVTPWLAASYQWAPRQHVYASWGEGIESSEVPDLPGYVNRGQALTAKSRQWEVGTKGQVDRTAWGLAWFDIDRPFALDTGTEVFMDGSQRHRGLEGNVSHAVGNWQLWAGAMWLHARREGSADATVNGLKPVNVPDQTLSVQVKYRVPQVTGLDLQARVRHEGRREVLADNSIDLPSWTRTDLSARYTHRLDGTQLTWTLGVFNAFDRQAWKESPSQYGHVYLFPLEARTVRLTLLAEI